MLSLAFKIGVGNVPLPENAVSERVMSSGVDPVFVTLNLYLMRSPTEPRLSLPLMNQAVLVNVAAGVKTVAIADRLSPDETFKVFQPDGLELHVSATLSYWTFGISAAFETVVEYDPALAVVLTR